MSEARTRRAGEERADEETLKKFDEWDKRPKPPPAVIVPDGDGQQADYDINALLDAASKEAVEQNTRLVGLQNQEYTYFVKCRYHGPNESAHGIYLSRLPGEGEVMGMTDWFSRYKPKLQEMYLGEIVCQVCFQAGVERSLEVELVGRRGQFKIPERMLWRRPKSQERLLAEGETRARGGRSPSSNQGREDAMERAAAAGLEKIP